MIAIVNITSKCRKRGLHTYEVRINREPLFTFKHKREERLSVCLTRAAKAAEQYELELLEQLF